MTRFLYALFAALILTACHSRDDDDGLLFAAISADSVELIVGQQTAVSVSNATDIRAVSEDAAIATATVVGNEVIIEGVSTGLTSVTIYGDRRAMRCRVNVKPGATSVDTDPESPQEPQDDAELSDDEVRYVSKMLTMRYQTPGTIFMCYTDGRRIVMRSLDTGDAVTFDFGTSQRNEHPLTQAALNVNGEDVALDSAAIVRVSDDRVWVRIHTAEWNHTVWLVVPL